MFKSVLLSVFLFLLNMPLVTANGMKDSSQSILIIHSYDSNFPWTKNYRHGLLDALDSNFYIHELFLNTRNANPKTFPKLVKNALKTYAQVTPDLVILADDFALQTLGQTITDNNTPVVFMGINNNPRNYFKNEKLPKNLSGILERPMLGPWLRYLSIMLPDATDSFFFFDGSLSSTAYINVFFNNKPIIKQGNILGNYLNTSDWEDWKAFVLGLKDNGYQFALLMNSSAVKDRDREIPHKEVIEWISKNSPVPFFGTQEWDIHDNGLIGALTLDAYQHGKLASNLTIDILQQLKVNNKLPPNVIKVDKSGTLHFNKKQLKRWEITLPARIMSESPRIN